MCVISTGIDPMRWLKLKSRSITILPMLQYVTPIHVHSCSSENQPSFSDQVCPLVLLSTRETMARRKEGEERESTVTISSSTVQGGRHSILNEFPKPVNENTNDVCETSFSPVIKNGKGVPLQQQYIVLRNEGTRHEPAIRLVLRRQRIHLERIPIVRGHLY